MKREYLRPAVTAAAIGTALSVSLQPAYAVDLPFSAESIITGNAMNARAAVTADVDGDGNIDVISASQNDDTIAWHRNDNGDGSAWTVNTITATADGAVSVFAADIDGDGDVDALSASINDNTVAWYRNDNGDGTAWTRIDITTTAAFAQSVSAADVDGDGDLDVVAASFNDDTIAWHENTSGDGSAWSAHTVTTSALGARSAVAADMDGDGDLDIVSASSTDNTVAWHENTSGDGSAWTAHTVTAAAGGARAVRVADVDGDGDNDIVAAVQTADQVVWYRNENGAGTSWTPVVINNTNPADGVVSVFPVDLDGDGDIDVVAASFVDDKLAWHENTAGDGSSWTERVISISGDAVFSAHAGDLDGDGDLDVVAASSLDNKVAWYRNTAAADVSVSVTDDTEPVQAGANVTYTSTVTNNGPDTATGVVLTNTLPPGSVFVSADPGCIHNAGVVTCSLGSLDAGQMTAVSVTVSAPNTAGTATDTVTVASNTADPNAANNADSEDTVVQAAGGGAPQAQGSGGGAFGPLGVLVLLALRRSRRACPVR